MKYLNLYKFRLFNSLIVFLLPIFMGAQNSFLDSLKAELKKPQSDTNYCKILTTLAEKAPDNEWPGFNSTLTKFCEEKIKTLKPGDPLRKRFLQYLSYGYHNHTYVAQLEGNYDNAISFAKKLIALIDETGDKEYLARAINNLGALYQRKNELITALEYYEKGIKINQEINNYNGIVFCYNQIGSILGSQGNIIKSIEYYEKGLKIAETNHLKEGIASSLYNLSLIYAKENEKDKAMEYAVKSLKLREENKERSGIGFSLNQIAALYLRKNEPQKALEYYLKALKVREDLGDKRSIAMSLQGIGSTYNQLNDKVRALEYFNKSYQINREIGEKPGACSNLTDLGQMKLKAGNLNEALDLYLQALKLSKETGNPTLIKECAINLDKIYTQKGDYKKAYEFYKLFVQMRDSLSNKETRNAIIRSQFSADYTQKEQALKAEQEKKEILHQKENIKKQADLEKQRMLTYSFMIGLILIIALAALILRNLKQSKLANKVITEQKREAEHQKEIIEEKQKEIVDSINYAKRIQYTLLAHDEFLKENLKDHFVFFHPKAIVSGDFYWATKKDNKFYIAVCDSTGHGVPGAFMSLLNISFLNEAINERNIYSPDQIFNYVRERLVESISKDQQKDGFDGILLCIDNNNHSITYSAANNKPLVLSQGKIIETKTDKMPVGIGLKKESFQLYTIEAEKGSSIYLYTDGYADQFGGPKGKKYKYAQLNDLIIANHHKPLEEQKQIFESDFEKWKGDLEQIDDVCLIGIKI